MLNVSCWIEVVCVRGPVQYYGLILILRTHTTELPCNTRSPRIARAEVRITK